MRTMSRGQIEYLKKQYPPGTRVQLDRMGDDPQPVPSGAKGTTASAPCIVSLITAD